MFIESRFELSARLPDVSSRAFATFDSVSPKTVHFWCGVFDGDQVGDRGKEIKTHLVAGFLKLISQLFGRTPPIKVGGAIFV